MRVTLIAAVASHGVIGAGGELPWHLPDDFAQFKRRTRGKPVVMGRRTWESLPKRPLPKRRNIVITTRPGYEAEGAIVVPSFEAALTAAGEAPEVMILGGARVYAAALPRADRMVLTHVDAQVEGDTFFPEVDWTRWRIVEEERHAADDRHAHPFRVVVYDKTI